MPSVIPIAKPQTEEQVLTDTHSHRRSASVTSSLWIACLVLIGVLLLPDSAAAQGCQEVGCDEEAPVVTPSFDPAVLPAVTMRITWCDNEWLMPATRTITLNGSNVVGSFTYSSQSGACASQAFSVATMNLNPGTTYTLFATIEDEHGNIGTGSAQLTTPNGWVVVEPKGLTVDRPQQSSNLNQQFIVKNPASVANNFRLVRTCLGQVSTCSAVPDTIHLNAGDDTTISVTYNTGLISSGTTGTLRLRARMTTDTTVADSTDVTVNLISSLIVDDSPTNNDAQNFGLCAYSCFANIYAHSTVPYFSLDQPRGVTLVHNHLRVWEKPYLLFNVSTVSGAPTVDYLKLTVRDSVTGAAISVHGDYYATPGNVYFRRDTGTVRIATLIKDNTWLLAHGTGIHPLQVTVTAVRSGLADEVDTLFVPVLVVREPPGAVARGWYMAGVQRLIPQSGGRVILVEGDGSAFVFTATDTLGSYQAPESEVSLLSRSGTGTNAIYTRAYPDSTRVRFDYQGRMIDASDSWGKKIKYAYDSFGRPTRLYDPFRTRPDSTAGPSAYTELVYFTDSILIRPPQADGSSYDASRVTRLRLTADSTLRAVIDPDGDSTRFTYRSGGIHPLQWSRAMYLDSVYDRSGVVRASFAYDESVARYVGSLRLFTASAAAIPAYVGKTYAGTTYPTVTLFDWRGRGVYWSPTSPSSLGAPVGLDTLYSDVRDAGQHQSFGRHDRWGQLLESITHNKKDTTRYFRSGLFSDSVRNPIGTVDRFTYTLLPGGRLAMASSTPAGQSGTHFEYDSLGRLSRIFGATTPEVTISRHGVSNPADIDQVFVAGVGELLSRSV